MMIIDRIEGGFALLEAEDGSIVEVDKSLLPYGAREGSVLRFEDGKYSLDEQKTEERRQRIAEKTRRLFKKM